MLLAVGVGLKNTEMPKIGFNAMPFSYGKALISRDLM